MRVIYANVTAGCVSMILLARFVDRECVCVCVASMPFSYRCLHSVCVCVCSEFFYLSHDLKTA